MSPYLGEFLGTFVFVLIVLMVVKYMVGENHKHWVPLVIGLGLAVSIYLAQAMKAKGHVNPAVSTGFFGIGQLSGEELAYHFAVQFAGAIVAFLVYKWVVKC